MCHIVNCFGRPIDSARDSGIPSCPTGKVFEIRSGFVFVALKAIVEASVRIVERGVPDPGPDAWGKARFSSFLSEKSKKGLNTHEYGCLRLVMS